MPTMRSMTAEVANAETLATFGSSEVRDLREQLAKLSKVVEQQSAVAREQIEASR